MIPLLRGNEGRAPDISASSSRDILRWRGRCARRHVARMPPHRRQMPLASGGRGMVTAPAAGRSLPEACEDSRHDARTGLGARPTVPTHPKADHPTPLKARRGWGTLKPPVGTMHVPAPPQPREPARPERQRRVYGGGWHAAPRRERLQGVRPEGATGGRCLSTGPCSTTTAAPQGAPALSGATPGACADGAVRLQAFARASG